MSLLLHTSISRKQNIDPNASIVILAKGKAALIVISVNFIR
jgi:hypothetical protein